MSVTSQVLFGIFLSGGNLAVFVMVLAGKWEPIFMMLVSSGVALFSGIALILDAVRRTP